jgi:N-acetylmuramoyl-L-alanine amidase
MLRPYTIMILVIAFLLAAPSSSWAIKIVIDPGHGGSDSGAVGVNGLYEKTVNLDIAKKLKTMLLARGYETAISREEDTFLSLKERVEFTNAQQADLFVSIHANSMPGNSRTRGALILYHDNRSPQEDYPASPEMTELTPQSKEFAQVVLNHFVDTAGMENRGLVQSAVYVVRMGTIPSILVETGFLSNRQDADLLDNDAVRTTMAQAIEQGIEAYMPPDTPNEVFTDMRVHWAREAVLRLKAQGIVDGVGRLFKPNRELTRAEWMTLLDRVFDLSKIQPNISSPVCTNGSSSVSSTVAAAVYKNVENCAKLPTPIFKDTTGHWAGTALNKAVSAHVLDGYEDATLRPDQPITRAEVAATFQRMALPQAIGVTSGAAFTDVPGDNWAAKAVYSLKLAGWIDGIAADRFMPERGMTRAEAASLLDRYIQSRGQTASPSS